jgi:N-acyl-D-aspartate/D-glutamate deacylase
MSTYDLVIRNGMVYDGTGMPGYAADVAIRDGRIAAIGRVAGTATREIDATGLAVTPGFIDVHTHYDVQLDWDPLATPSSWHGATTVLTGNCGFSLAPAKPEDVDWLAGMLSRVEGMSRPALREGLRFRGGTFADYWRRFDGRIGVNVGSYVGHCAVRRWVMGDDASNRRATSDEIAAMQALVRQAMHDGALGFSTSQLDIHVGEDGRGVPSNHAGHDEIVALGGVLAEFDRGAIEIIPRTFGDGYGDDDRRLVLDLYRVSGRPVELNVLLPTPENPMSWQRTLDFVREAAAAGARLHPQFTTNELGLHLKLCDTFVFDEMPAWRDALTASEPERSRRLRDPVVRARMAAEWDGPGRAAAFPWDVLYVETVRDRANAAWIGLSTVDLAVERGVTPLDAFLDCSLAEDLETQWETKLTDMSRQFIRHVVKSAIGEPLVMAGSSDGGAHLASFVGADYTTRLLAEWVPDALSFEQAVWRLAGMPATVHGLVDRGFLREGAWADVLLIDRTKLRAGTARLARDFPADTERYVVDAEGYAAVIVNGQVLLEGGRHTGALPGHVLRGA